MIRILLLTLLVITFGAVFSCTGQKEAKNNSPTEAYKQLYAAVKAKNIDEIKSHLTKKTIEFGAMSAQRYGTAPEKMYENGFTATTFSDNLPAIRDERITENMGAIEVWNSKESKWEDLPFILEDGSWKLAMGELFAGTFKSPGKGRDLIEKEAANAVSGGPTILGTNSMPNSNSINTNSTSKKAVK